VYYKAEQLALNNNRTYHLAAILRRKRRVVRIGENTNKTHPDFKRAYPDGAYASHMHAEMNVLRFARPGDIIEVFRIKKETGKYTMAKPCSFCHTAMQKAEIRYVRYTDWNGTWKIMKI
jgi:tRNA(Arg) A34 adenosine deaminase TadA